MFRARFMRKCDRLEHGERYPMLSYPELYILDGGYKAFYGKYANLCIPRGYLPMLDRDCRQAMRRCRAQCKRDSGQALKPKTNVSAPKRSPVSGKGDVIRTALRF
jgi:hypothetical protein